MKKVKAGKEGADTRILGVFSAYRGAHRQPRGRYMDLRVSYCIQMYPGGADRNTFGYTCIADVLGVYCGSCIHECIPDVSVHVS